MKFGYVSSRLFEENQGDNGAGAGAGAGATSGNEPPEWFKGFMAQYAKDREGTNKTLNKLDKNYKELSKPKPDSSEGNGVGENQPPNPDDQRPPNPNPPQHTPLPEGVKVDQETVELRRRVERQDKAFNDLKTKLEDTERAKQESDRRAAIEKAVGDIPFKDAKSKSLFLKAVTQDILRDDEGELVAKVGTELIPMTEYIKTQADEMPNLLAPRGDGGAGSRPGGIGTAKFIDINDIGPSSTPEQKRAYAAQIARTLAEGAHQ